ncbi:MAG: DUF1553 domain-containing protein [Pirellula sp.]
MGRKVLYAVALWMFGLSLMPAAALAEGMIQYNRDIRPILSDNCFACHGPDEKTRAADLRLDQRAAAVDAKAIIPGDVNGSSILQRIVSTDEDQVMPPPSSHKKLTAQQKELLKQWIAEGAEYQGHWAYLPPVKPELPQVRNAGWVRSPIDRFVLAELERRGIEPAPDADLRTLIRRVCLDLTGLPPSPDEVERVLSDPSAERYENYVDELLSRQEWGEHRGRYWLDYARFADTHGIHFDNFREMWSYREWVIKALNRNMPFDQFTIEQLAGDLLPNPTLDQKIASGFHRCNITTSEGGAIDEEYKVLYARDRVETTGQVWLGLTVGCAVCHDHKFDPISQREFYQLAAFFNNTTQNAMDGNAKDTPPIIQVPLDADRERFAALDGLIAEAQQKMDQRKVESRPAYEGFAADTNQRDAILWNAAVPTDGLETHIPLRSQDPKSLAVWHAGQFRQLGLSADATLVPGHVGDFAWQVNANEFPTIPAGDLERDQAFSIALWVQPGTDTQGGSLLARMNDAAKYRGWDVWMENGNVGMHLIHQWPENAIKASSTERLTASRWQHVAITYDGSGKAEGVRIYFDGREVGKNIQMNTLSDTARTEVPLRIGRRHVTSATVGAKLQDIRIYRKLLAVEELKTIGSLTRRQYLIAKSQRTPEDNEELFRWYLADHDPEYPKLTAAHQQLVTEKADILRRGTIAHIMNERNEPPKAYVLMRGEYDKRSDEVAPGTPSVLHPYAESLPRNRLGLAQWLLDPNNPLTARVTVNRFWQEVFGQGIVPSTGDFGITGQLPSHPELLDYLAVSFREDGWNIKNLFRTMVTSSTYRQSASASPEKLGVDAPNKYLARGPRFRMDAEMIRDYALSTSGLLVTKIGGPSVRPYQPPGVWEAVAMPGSNTRDYVADTGEGLYRRSLYTFLKRSAPPPNMEVFNATAREVCTVKRERTNTPLQALVTLNDVQFIEAARILAQKTLQSIPDTNDTAGRLQWIASKLLGRPLRGDELGVAQGVANDLLAHYRAQNELAKDLLAVGATRSPENLDAAELAAWTMVVNTLMNLDEVLTK